MQTEVENIGRADLHIHSQFGDGMASISDLLEHVENRTNLDVIAITDHDDIEGGLRARELALMQGLRFEVIVGAEVTTVDGHLLALFINEPVRSFQPLAKTIYQIHEQGGICIVPHPMSWLTRSVGQRTFERIMASSANDVYFDGIETLNATIAGRVCGGKVCRLNQNRYRLAETGGSDAHFLAVVGRGYTKFAGKTSADLRRSLEEKTTSAELNATVGMSDVPYSQVLRQQYRSLVFMPARKVRRRASMLFKGRNGS